MLNQLIWNLKWHWNVQFTEPKRNQKTHLRKKWQYLIKLVGSKSSFVWFSIKRTTGFDLKRFADYTPVIILNKTISCPTDIMSVCFHEQFTNQKIHRQPLRQVAFLTSSGVHGVGKKFQILPYADGCVRELGQVFHSLVY